MFPFRGLLPKCLSDWDQSQDLRTQSSSPTQVAETQATRATTCCLLWSTFAQEARIRSGAGNLTQALWDVSISAYSATTRSGTER